MYFKYVNMMNQSQNNYSLQPNTYLRYKNNQNQNQNNESDE